jgi:hypothetical protein
MDKVIQSAAFYCSENVEGNLREAWFATVLQFFESQGLPFREYCVDDNEICSESRYIFTSNDSQLHTLLSTGALRSLDLYFHTTRDRNLYNTWEGHATINLDMGYTHFGVVETSTMPLDLFFRLVYELVRSIVDWRYGIGYLRSSRNTPALYALGAFGGYATDSPDDSDRVECWGNEIFRRARHLQGYFRQVYPVNLLSPKHVRTVVDEKTGQPFVGQLEPIDEGHWIWTVADEDIPKAEDALRQAKLLLC